MYQASENIITSGQPSIAQFKALAKSGVKVIINLAPDNRFHFDEASLIAHLGMIYIHNPVLWGGPKWFDLERFMQALDNNKREKILVHCVANYRATAFMAIYRVKRMDWTSEAALNALKDVWDLDKYPIWKSFVLENIV